MLKLFLKNLKFMPHAVMFLISENNEKLILLKEKK